MSIEIRNVCDRPDNCTMGKVKPAGFTDHCGHTMQCDWGILGNPAADARRHVEPLMLIYKHHFNEMLKTGSYLDWRGSTGLARTENGRRFFDLEYDGQRWTWELFEAHWWDEPDVSQLYLGRWPD